MLETIAPISPVYIILIVGMVIFAASNAMPGLLPDPSKLGHLAPFVLQWGFLIVLFALLATMTGVLPGVPSLHVTYVHLACAGLLFGLMWNHIVANNFPDPPKKSSSSGSSGSSSSSSSSSRSKESSSSSSSSSSSKSRDGKSSSSSSSSSKEKSGTTAGSPWDDLRAHPSAFLTTRMNRLMPWPFPMGKATPKGSEVWWESGTPSHVGHYNKPTQLEVPSKDSKKEEKEGSSSKSSSSASSDSKEKKLKEDGSKERPREEEAKRSEKKEREQSKLQSGKDDSRPQEPDKERVREKDEQKAKEKEREREKEALMHQQKTKAGLPGEEAQRVSSSTSTQPQAQSAMTGDRETRRLLRTKFLVLIAGLSLVDKTLGFFLLLFYTIRLLAQELNGTEMASSDKPSMSSGRGIGGAGGFSKLESGQPEVGDSAAEAARLEKMKALREAQAAKAKDEEKKGGSSSGSSSSERARGKERGPSDESSKSKSAPGGENSKSSSSSVGKEEKSASRSSGESKEKSSSSSSSGSSKDTITSAAVKEAAGSQTETKAPDRSASAVQPVGMGMHYIYQHGGGMELESGPCFIPSEGVSHPLMTTLSKHWAN